MGSILIIKNNNEIEANIEKALEKDYKIYVVNELWDGLDILDANHIDVFVIIFDGYFDEKIWDFIKEVHTKYLETTPFIFVSEKPNEKLYETIAEYPWYHISYPINYERFLTVIKRAVRFADNLDDKMVILKKNSADYYYKAKFVTSVQRKRDKYVTVSSCEPQISHEKQEYSFKYPLADFITRHQLTKYLTQVHQSWLVNKEQIIKVSKTDMDLELKCGTRVPIGPNFIEQFYPIKTSKSKRRGDES